MSPAILALIIQAAQALLQEAPEIAADIGAIFGKKNPTQADWDAVFAKVKTYDSYNIKPPAKTPVTPAAPGGSSV